MVNKPRRRIHVFWLCPLTTTFKDLLFLPTFFCFYPLFSWWTPVFWYERHSLVLWRINTSPETQRTSRTSNMKLQYQNIKAHGFVVSFDVFQSADRVICSQYPPFSPHRSAFTIVATSNDRKCKYARRSRYLCTKWRIMFRRTDGSSGANIGNKLGSATESYHPGEWLSSFLESNQGHLNAKI